MRSRELRATGAAPMVSAMTASVRSRRLERRVGNMRLDVALCLPQEAETVALVRGVVTNALASFGVTQVCIDDIRLALSEACTNVLDHADDDDEYEVTVEIDGQQCAIAVKNTGIGFDGSTLDGVMPDATSARGRGIGLMFALMDHVDLTSDPETGTIVRLVKQLVIADHTPLARFGRPRAVYALSCERSPMASADDAGCRSRRADDLPKGAGALMTAVEIVRRACAEPGVRSE